MPSDSSARSVRIGISGWTYAPWRKVFYPEGLRLVDELGYASRAFPSIEINGSFYSLMRPENYRAWYEAVPADFVFAVKGGRYVTHMKRLRDVRPALANFFASGVACLREKLGPILWQLPPHLAFDADTLRAFFELLPRTGAGLLDLAEQHAAWMQGRSATREALSGKVRHALEVRHPSFLDPRYVALLREYDIASVVADSAGRYPSIEDLCSDFVYVRLHGSKRLYVSGYGERELEFWAERIRAWADGYDPPGARLVAEPLRGSAKPREVFVYFDNDAKVRAPFDAENLARILRGQRPRRLPKAVAALAEGARTTATAASRPLGS